MSFWRRVTERDRNRNEDLVERINNVEMVHDGIDQAFDGLGNMLNGTRNNSRRFRWRDRWR